MSFQIGERQIEKVMLPHSTHIAESEKKDGSWHIYGLKALETFTFFKGDHVQKGLSLGVGYIYL